MLLLVTTYITGYSINENKIKTYLFKNLMYVYIGVSKDAIQNLPRSAAVFCWFGKALGSLKDGLSEVRLCSMFDTYERSTLHITIIETIDVFKFFTRTTNNIPYLMYVFLRPQLTLYTRPFVHTLKPYAYHLVTKQLLPVFRRHY